MTDSERPDDPVDEGIILQAADEYEGAVDLPDTPPEAPGAPAEAEPETSGTPEGSAAADKPDFQAIAGYTARQSAHTLPVRVLGLTLLVLGVILIWPVVSGGYILLPEIIAAVALAGAALSGLLYWLSSGRSAQGMLFLMLAGLATTALTAGFVLTPETLNIVQLWPLYLIILGIAFLLTMLLSRWHDRRLFVPALILIAAGLAALAVTTGRLPADLDRTAQVIWPWLLGGLILGLLPLAVRQASDKA
ncbi:MAG: hypothetical protein JXN59_01295 [Anaerolineae bacterium]|nr:hypothetical protein [Anaerolineae bacterium]